MERDDGMVLSLGGMDSTRVSAAAKGDDGWTSLLVKQEFR